VPRDDASSVFWEQRFLATSMVQGSGRATEFGSALKKRRRPPLSFTLGGPPSVCREPQSHVHAGHGQLAHSGLLSARPERLVHRREGLAEPFVHRNGQVQPSRDQMCGPPARKLRPGLHRHDVMKCTIRMTRKDCALEIVSENYSTFSPRCCITGLIRALAVPASKTQGEPGVFPFKF